MIGPNGIAGQGAPSPLPERTPAEAEAGIIATSVGGQPVRLPVLLMGRNRQWVHQFHQAIDEVVAGAAPIETVGALADYGVLALDRIGALVKAYDETGVLGEQYPDNAYPGEIHDTFRKVLSAAFPFEDDLATRLLQMVQLRQIRALASSSSTKPSPRSTGGRSRRSTPR